MIRSRRATAARPHSTAFVRGSAATEQRSSIASWRRRWRTLRLDPGEAAESIVDGLEAGAPTSSSTTLDFRPSRDIPVSRTRFTPASAPASRTIVTGPSLTSATSMRAPKTPLSTPRPRSRSAPAEALVQALRLLRRRAGETRPVALAVSASSVNWLTTRTAPPVSRTERSKRPSSFAKIRSRATFPASRSASASPSPSATPTSTSRPAPISPATRPSTRTTARETPESRPHVDPHYGR